jgi:hypothetical protein
MSETFRFTGETNIRLALELDDRVAEAFRRLGLKCLDKRGELCVAADVETLADASRYHEVPLERILGELNALAVVPKPAPPPDA